MVAEPEKSKGRRGRPYGSQTSSEEKYEIFDTWLTWHAAGESKESFYSKCYPTISPEAIKTIIDTKYTQLRREKAKRAAQGTDDK